MHKLRKIISSAIKFIGLDKERMKQWLLSKRAILYIYLTVIKHKLRGQSPNDTVLVRYIIYLKRRQISSAQFDKAIRYYFGKKKFRPDFHAVKIILVKILNKSRRSYTALLKPITTHWSYFQLMFYLSGIYYKLLSLSPISTYPSKPARKKGKAVIIYSKQHFDPNQDDYYRKFAHSSSANLARAIFASLSNYDIVYRDFREALMDIRDAEVVMGIVSKAFIHYARSNPNAKKILFFVNSHPMFRLLTLGREARRGHARISPHEYPFPFMQIRCMKLADRHVAIGNEAVLGTFKKYGNFHKPLDLIDSYVNTEIYRPDDSKLPKDKIRILFTGTTLGLRKGVLRCISLWHKLSTSSVFPKLELLLIGQNVEYPTLINQFQKRYSNVHFGHWEHQIDEYKKEIQSGHIVLGLSLEEGQVGSVSEAIATGAVPIVTEACGINLAHEKDGYVIKEYNEDEAARYIVELTNNPPMLMEMRQNAARYAVQNLSIDKFKNHIKRLVFDE